MSIRRLPRQLGIIVTCNHGNLDGREDCHTQIQTANTIARSNRAYAAQQGWGRGLISKRKRFDLCPPPLPARAAGARTAEGRAREEAQGAGREAEGGLR